MQRLIPRANSWATVLLLSWTDKLHCIFWHSVIHFNTSASEDVRVTCVLAGETYTFNFPSYYVRGLLIGVMRMEIAGDVQISCKETGFQWTASFTNRGYFKGENNSVSGKVTRIGSKDTICKIDGRWDRVIKITGNVLQHDGTPRALD